MSQLHDSPTSSCLSSITTTTIDSTSQLIHTISLDKITHEATNPNDFLPMQYKCSDGDW